MGYKYRNGGTPDHVNSEDSNSTVTNDITPSDTTDLKNRIQAQKDSMMDDMRTGAASDYAKAGHKTPMSQTTKSNMDSRMNKIISLTDSLDKARKK